MAETIITDKGLARRVGEETSVNKVGFPQVRGDLVFEDGHYFVSSGEERAMIERGDTVGIYFDRPSRGDRGHNFLEYAGR